MCMTTVHYGTMLDELRLILKQTRTELIRGFLSLPSLLVTSTPSDTDSVGFLSLYYALRDFRHCSSGINLPLVE